MHEIRNYEAVETDRREGKKITLSNGNNTYSWVKNVEISDRNCDETLCYNKELPRKVSRHVRLQ